MIASLPMYDRPECAGAHARYWSLIRVQLAAQGIDSPARLAQEKDERSVWTDPNLVLSQTCGMPYRLWLHGKVALIGTPDFGLDGCPPGYYCSLLIVRRHEPRQTVEEFADATFAYNQTTSQSGYAAPYQHCLPYGFWFRNRRHKEQHLNSARAVANGCADIAALDAVSWRLMARFDRFASRLRVLDRTEPTPGLPYIAAATADSARTYTAVEAAIAALTDDDRDLLGIRGLVAIAPETYLAVPNPDA